MGERLADDQTEGVPERRPKAERNGEGEGRTRTRVRPPATAWDYFRNWTVDRVVTQHYGRGGNAGVSASGTW
jgi:hypothetical protein